MLSQGCSLVQEDLYFAVIYFYLNDPLQIPNTASGAKRTMHEAAQFGDSNFTIMSKSISSQLISLLRQALRCCPPRLSGPLV